MASDAEVPMKVPLPAPLVADGRSSRSPLGGEGEASASKVTDKPNANAKAKAKLPKEGDADPPKAKAKAKKGSGKGKAKASHFRLNVRNLHVSITTDKLIELFEPYGKVVQAQVRTHEDGTSRTIGFVTFSTEEEAMVAMDKMGGKMVKGKALKIEPAELKPSAMEMQAVQQADYRQRQAAYLQYVNYVRQHQQLAYMSSMFQAAHMQQAMMAAYMQQAQSAYAEEDGDAAEYFESAGDMGMWPSSSGAEWDEAAYGDMSGQLAGSYAGDWHQSQDDPWVNSLS